MFKVWRLVDHWFWASLPKDLLWSYTLWRVAQYLAKHIVLYFKVKTIVFTIVSFNQFFLFLQASVSIIFFDSLLRCRGKVNGLSSFARICQSWIEPLRMMSIWLRLFSWIIVVFFVLVIIDTESSLWSLCLIPSWLASLRLFLPSIYVQAFLFS